MSESWIEQCNFVSDEEGATAAVGSGGEAGTQISLESLFRRATSQQQSGGAGVVQAVLGGAGQGPPTGGTQPPPLLRFGGFLCSLFSRHTRNRDIAIFHRTSTHSCSAEVSKLLLPCVLACWMPITKKSAGEKQCSLCRRSQSEAPVRMNDPGRAGSGMPAVLQRLMSNPGQ